VKLDSLLVVVKERFPGRVGQLNLEVIRKAHEEAVKG